VFRKQNPEPDEEEYFGRGDVYDKKRKVFITADQALSKAEREYNAAEDKFVNDVWKQVYTSAIDNVTEWLGEHGYKSSDFGLSR
jgi:hypothetical protein